MPPAYLDKPVSRKLICGSPHNVRYFVQYRAPFYSQMFIKCNGSLKKIVVSSGFRLEKELILRRITGCDSTES
jgi:hypothetical protein